MTHYFKVSQEVLGLKVSTVGQRPPTLTNTSEGFLKEAGAVLDLSRQDSAL